MRKSRTSSSGAGHRPGVVQRRALRYGIHAAIIGAGVLFASGRLHDTAYIARAPLVKAAKAAPALATARTAWAPATSTAPLAEAGRRVSFTAGLDQARVK